MTYTRENVGDDYDSRRAANILMKYHEAKAVITGDVDVFRRTEGADLYLKGRTSPRAGDTIYIWKVTTSCYGRMYILGAQPEERK